MPFRRFIPELVMTLSYNNCSSLQTVESITGSTAPKERDISVVFSCYKTNICLHEQYGLVRILHILQGLNL